MFDSAQPHPLQTRQTRVPDPLQTTAYTRAGSLDTLTRLFKKACDAGQAPAAFVEELKAKGIRVSGIGHRIKSKDNRDKRVELLQNYARKVSRGCFQTDGRGAV